MSQASIDSRLLQADKSGYHATGTLENLLSDGGLEIPNAPEVCVLMRPAARHRRWATHSTASYVPKNGDPPHIVDFFESSEHVIIAEDAQIPFSSTVSEPAISYLFPMPNGLQLTYGQIIALAGDFYGDPAQPIADEPTLAQRQAKILSNFQSLADDLLAAQQVPAILKTLHREFEEVTLALQAGKQPSAAYEELGDTLSQQWNVDTGGGRVLGWLPFGRYLNLAATNWDHFGQAAMLCYQAGHLQAMQMAAEATTTGALQRAYALNAFADHFLTDLFSAGHIRTPRERMYKDEGNKLKYRDLASLLARIMHDEDSHYGLWVDNARGDVWIAYGDKRFRDTADYANAAIVQDAVQQSINDVYGAYESRTAPVDGFGAPAFSYVPNLNANWTDPRNFSPLFWLNPANNQVGRRDDVNNRLDYSWTYSWWVWSTWLLLKVRYSGPPMMPNGPGTTGPHTGPFTALSGQPPGATGLYPTGPDVPPGGEPSRPIGTGGPSGPATGL